MAVLPHCCRDCLLPLGLTVLVGTGVAGCGSTGHAHQKAKAAASTRTAGTRRGVRIPDSPYRMCGYLSNGPYTASEVMVGVRRTARVRRLLYTRICGPVCTLWRDGGHMSPMSRRSMACVSGRSSYPGTCRTNALLDVRSSAFYDRDTGGAGGRRSPSFISAMEIRSRCGERAGAGFSRGAFGARWSAVRRGMGACRRGLRARQAVPRRSWGAGGAGVRGRSARFVVASSRRSALL